MLGIRQIECGQAAWENISFRVVFQRQVQCCGLVLDMVLDESIHCPEGGVGL